MINSNMDSFKNITLLRDQSVSIRGHPKIQVSPYITYYGRKLNCYNIPFHSLTHMCFSESFNATEYSNLIKIHKYSNICIIDCTDKKKFLLDNKYIHSYKIDDFFETTIYYPYINYYFDTLNNSENDIDNQISNKLLKLLQELDLSYSYILSKVNEEELKKSDFLLFYTDWPSLRFNTETLGIHDEMSHAYLIHPYISTNTIELINRNFPNLKGIGTDVPSLNNPLKYTNNFNSHPNVFNTLLKAENRGFFPFKNDDIKTLFLKESIYSAKIRPKTFQNYSNESLKKLFLRNNIPIPLNNEIHSISYLERTIWDIDSKKVVYQVLIEKDRLFIYRKKNLEKFIIYNMSFDNIVNNIKDKNKSKLWSELLIIPIQVLSDITGIACEAYIQE